MKNKIFLSFAFAALSFTTVNAQNVTARTNEFEVDFSDPKKAVTTTIPVINWVTPIPETNYAQENKFKIKVEIQEDSPIKDITIFLKEGESPPSRVQTTVKPKAGRELNFS